MPWVSYVNYILLALTVLSVGVGLARRVFGRISFTGRVVAKHQTGEGPAGRDIVRVVNFKNCLPIAGARVWAKSADGRVWAKGKTDEGGLFETEFPVGEHTLSVRARGFEYSLPAAEVMPNKSCVVYTGGTISVKSERINLMVEVAMKPKGIKIGFVGRWLLSVWHLIQHNGHLLMWMLLVAGVAVNTWLLLWTSSPSWLVVEAIYVVLVAMNIILIIYQEPKYGLVRDAVTHVPIDLAIVRLYEEGTNRLVMTRSTSPQGQFFALPPPGTYDVAVAKPGYALFTKQGVKISGSGGAASQLRVDLMPVAPLVS